MGSIWLGASIGRPNAPDKEPKYVGAAFAQAKDMTTYFGRY